MAAITNPFPLLSDVQGRLLDEGFVYIGEPEQDPEAAPKAAFWDAEMTVAAEQPLRTIAGLIARAGAPASVYVDGAYSIRVRDGAGVEVFYYARVSGDDSARNFTGGADELQSKLSVPVASEELGNQPASAVRPAGRLVADTDLYVLRLHDNETPGGRIFGDYYKAPYPGGVVRTLTAKSSERLSIKDFGASGLNADNATPAVTAGIAGTPSGGTLVLPTTGNTGNAYVLGTSLLVNKSITLDGDTAATLRHDVGLGSTSDLMRWDVPGSSRGARIRGMNIAVYYTGYNPDYYPSIYDAGGFAVTFNKDGASSQGSIIGHWIEGAIMRGGAAGCVLYKGAVAGAKEVAYSGISKSTIENGVDWLGADGPAFLYNISFGKKPAYTFDMPLGAYCPRVIGGTTSNHRGAIDGVDCSLLYVDGLQVEHGVTNTEPNPEWDGVTYGPDGKPTTWTGSNLPRSAHKFQYARSDQTLGSQNVLRGIDYPGVLARFWGLNNGGSGFIARHYALFNQRCTSIDWCNLGITVADDLIQAGNDIFISQSCIDVVIGSHNVFHGLPQFRPLIGANQYTDMTRRGRIEPEQTSPGSGIYRLEKGHRGIWYPALDVFESIEAGWSSVDAAIRMDNDGMLKMRGRLTGGVVSAGSDWLLGTLRQWARPTHEEDILVWARQGNAIVATVYPNGQIRVKSNLTSANITLGPWHGVPHGYDYHQGAV